MVSISTKIKRLLAIMGIAIFLVPIAATPAQAISIPQSVSTPISTVAQTDGGTDDGRRNDTNTDVNCQNDRGNPFTSILCAIVDGLFNMLSLFYEFVVVNFLAVELPQEGPNGEPTAIYTIWNNFRVLANIAFIGVFLVAIIGQSFSWFFTPYELKKILPRLFIGVIAIQLSWFFSVFIIDVFNLLGAGIHGLMLAPLGDVETGAALNFDGVGRNITAVIALLGSVGAVITASTTAGALSGMLPVLLGLALGVLAAFITLLLRQTLILLLLVTSPLAFVAWILPNTSSVFKTWWSFFTKALVMYPLIIMLITAGQFFAGLISLNANAGNGVTVSEGVLSVVALFAPYLLIPSTFRFAGGAIATLSGNMNTWSKQLDQRIFGDERIAGTRRHTRKANMERRKAQRKVDFYYRANSLGTDSAGNVTNKTLNRVGKRSAWAAASMGPNALARAGKMRAEAYKMRDDLVQNGRDGLLFALASGNGLHPIHGGALDATDVAEAQQMIANGLFNNEYAAEAIANYVVTKGVPGNEIDKGRQALMNNPALARNMSKKKRERIWDQAINQDNIVALHPDQRYRQDGQMVGDADNLRMPTKYLQELNSRFGPGQSARFQQSAYEGAETYMNVANDVKQRAIARSGGIPGTDVPDSQWTRHLNTDEREFLETSRLFYNNTVQRRESGPEASNETIRKMRRNKDMNWLGDLSFTNERPEGPTPSSQPPIQGPPRPPDFPGGGSGA